MRPSILAREGSLAELSRYLGSEGRILQLLGQATYVVSKRRYC
jgi:hypothetical protein